MMRSLSQLSENEETVKEATTLARAISVRRSQMKTKKKKKIKVNPKVRNLARGAIGATHAAPKLFIISLWY